MAASSLPVSVVDAVALRRCPTGLACCAGASAGHLADSPVTEYLRFRGSITTATDDQLSSPDMLSIAASRHSRSSLPRRFESTIRLDVGRIAVERAARSLRNSQASMAPLTSPARTTRWLRQPCAPPWPNPTACVNGGLVGRQYGGPLAGPHLVPHLGRIWAGNGDRMPLTAESGRKCVASSHVHFAVRRCTTPRRRQGVP